MSFDDVFLGMSLMGGVITAVLYFAILAPPFIYLVLKWRILRDTLPNDPHLTVRIVLHLFQTISIFLFLGAFTAFGVALIGDPNIEGWNFGLILAAMLLWSVHQLGLNKLPAEVAGAVERAYRALRILLMGAVGTVAIVLLLVSLFEGDFDKEHGRYSIILVVVWCTPWFIETGLLLRKPSDWVAND